MTTTEAQEGRYRIAEAAELSGFAATTLRFYEDEGVLSPAARSAAGYRMYDDRDVERLRLVARAKELGCTLEEIKGLVEAWDADECAPVKHQLRVLVASKAAEADRRISELAELGRQLRATSATLAVAPVDGPCDDTCGCATASSHETPGCDCGSITCGTASATVTMGATVGLGPSCSLNGRERAERVDEWRRLLGGADRRDQIPGGVRFALDASTELTALAGLVAAERDCCSFFSFALTVDSSGTSLEVTAPPEGASMLAKVFGEAS
ncbi:MAG: MerR family transcriptional regulator [Acidimicrobiia bacterium]|nr:MerR family transcriptional regulator [Acidimicrobiia bacterium]